MSFLSRFAEELLIAFGVSLLLGGFKRELPFGEKGLSPLNANFQLLKMSPSLRIEDPVVVGDYAKLIFTDGTNRERMWVQVQRADGDIKRGILSNDPQLLTKLQEGDTVFFRQDHVVDVLRAESVHKIGNALRMGRKRFT